MFALSAVPLSRHYRYTSLAGDSLTSAASLTHSTATRQSHTQQPPGRSVDLLHVIGSETTPTARSGIFEVPGGSPEVVVHNCTQLYQVVRFGCLPNLDHQKPRMVTCRHLLVPGTWLLQPVTDVLASTRSRCSQLGGVSSDSLQPLRCPHELREQAYTQLSQLTSPALPSASVQNH